MESQAFTPAQALFFFCFVLVLTMPLLALSMNPGIELWVQDLIVRMSEHASTAAAAL